ncbi:hypothetical protein [Butyricimonas synergistica]|uniref:hypothetical protein n=1 Tax=Butyricimonas synergistica TaxID=544644 RepID=UPI000381F4D8|nr:hypothetical protein [Butyricimonas synergistica]
MAEFVNPIGKIRGKYGNVIGYVRPDGKNCCRSTSLKRKSGGEPQKRQSMAFGTVAGRKQWMMVVIRLGFPGGNGYGKGFNGFTGANVKSAVVVEKIDPEKPVSNRKKAEKEFSGVIDYGKLRVAAGQLVSPMVDVEVDAGNRKVVFTHEGMPVESVDCFSDDKVYGVMLSVPKRRCRLQELGTRGESFVASMDFPGKADADGLFVYVFAVRADGKDTSDSICVWEPEA